MVSHVGREIAKVVPEKEDPTLTRWIGIALLALGVTACETSTSAENEPVAPEGTFELQAFELSSGQVVTVPDPSRYTVTFLPEARLSAQTDCNFCNGSYELSGSGFDVGLLACTLAACHPESLETPFVQALDSAFALELRGTELLIFYPDGTLRFTSM